MPKIQVTTPEGVTHEFELTAPSARIGRAEDNDLVVPETSVSSYHGEITLTDSGIHMQDRGSTNGTHVDGQRVESADIPWGGTFRLGNSSVVLIGDGDGDAEAAVAEAPVYEEAPVEESVYEEPVVASGGYSGGGYGSLSGGSAVITGLGSTPCPSQLRRGFGPKVKEKTGGGLLILLSVLGMLACGAAAFLIFQMTA